MFVNLNTLVKEVRDVVIPTDRGFVFNPYIFIVLDVKDMKVFYYTNIVLIEIITL